MPCLDLVKLFFDSLRKFGLKFALKSALSYLGIKVYSAIKYPVTGIKVTVRADVCWKELERGRWELNCIRHLSNAISEGQTILDVGAWAGQYTLLFSKLVGDKGHVYAFDPDPKAFDLLRDNIEKNSLTNVHVEKVGVSNSVGKTKLKAWRFGRGFSFFQIGDLTNLRETIVDTTTIDRYCEENEVCPDGIKIDVEGAEGLVIEGCRNVIEKFSPWVLLEFHGSFMSEEERKRNWHKIVDSAKKVIFVDGNSDQYHYGSEVKSMPDCPRFHVFIKY